MLDLLLLHLQLLEPFSQILILALELQDKRADAVGDTLVGALRFSLQAQLQILLSFFGPVVVFNQNLDFSFERVQFEVQFLDALIAFD